jgi:hypothetical protein
MFMRILRALLIMIFSFLSSAFTNSSTPFDYDLHLTRIPGTSSKTIVVFHGMGGDYTIAPLIKAQASLNDTLVTFNFPDYGIRDGIYNAKKTSYGSIQELLPAIFVLKKLIVDEQIKEINLYGFSAGGGAIINTLAVLNTSKYDADLKSIGVNQKDKEKILEEVQKGTIILDAPLKSVAEIIDFRGTATDLVTIGERYRENDMEPIGSIEKLKGLSLHFIVHFQNHDLILSNRDDQLFYDRLKKVNADGTTLLIIGNDGGHNLPHPSLWKFYKENK